MSFNYELIRADRRPCKSTFPHLFPSLCANPHKNPMKCLEEWNIYNISSAIRGKPEWQRKYKDKVITEKWRTELEEQFKDKSDYFEEIWTYVLEELKWYERLENNFPGFQENGFKIAFDDKIAYSDTTISEETKCSLKKEVEKFVEQEFANGLDYHPGSDDKVVDIVHPSLYPLRYRVTPYYATRGSDLSIVEVDKMQAEGKYFVAPWKSSKAYQWLPALMSWPKLSSGKEYVFQSYINNLHPKYENIYHIIEDVFNSAVPGLNYILSRYKSGVISRIQLDNNWYTDEWKKIEDDFNEKFFNETPFREKEFREGYAKLKQQKINYLKAPSIEYKKDYPIDYTFDLRKQFPYLKIIVKLANIELSPENPFYSGGSWHVEGTTNEDIVATILYYYDIENITDSSLSFKYTYEEPWYEQDDAEGLKKVFGLKDEDRLSKKIGGVVCQEDRLLVFPNSYLHHVEPFELKDKTKPGHRKILCMFLVDPYNEAVITTAQVPPQQETWHEKQKMDELLLKEEYHKIQEEQKKNEHYKSPEIWDMFQFFKPSWRLDVDSLKNSKEARIWPESLESAKEDRKRLMKERSPHEDDSDEYFSDWFSLCEH